MGRFPPWSVQSTEPEAGSLALGARSEDPPLALDPRGRYKVAMSDPSKAWVAALTRFKPEKSIEAPPDWDEAVHYLSRHGLAAIAAYNLQYQMPGADVPPDLRDFLLGYMQGGANDNVLKLMTLRQLASLFGEREFIVLDGAAFADTLYPHISFRLVPELKILVRPEDRDPIVKAVEPEGFVEMEGEEPDPDRPAATLYNDKFYLKLYTSLLPKGGEEKLFERAVPALPYGRSARRMQAEDALLVHVLSLARRGFRVPRIYFVDLRELVRGDSPVIVGPGPGAPLDPALVLERAEEMGVNKALWAAMEILADFHPEVAEAARTLSPKLPAPLRALIQTTVVQGAEKERALRGSEKLVRLLLE